MMENTIETKPELKPSAKPLGLPTELDAKTREFMDLVIQILSISNELALELATIDCANVKTCGVCVKAKELILKLKQFIALTRSIRQ